MLERWLDNIFYAHGPSFVFRSFSHIKHDQPCRFCVSKRIACLNTCKGQRRKLQYRLLLQLRSKRCFVLRNTTLKFLVAPGVTFLLRWAICIQPQTSNIYYQTVNWGHFLRYC
ncbi:hypothetical protein TGARI_245480 [Toxoplasma gondii ARI]|uniref:Uncharacterized protein n=1 Tax=Toxoplasma gondii ARI TaxID=1074872 RepID=A0A139YAE8_TOXGO|nr:hypothetical protein TGARI_245480 [Toxoplasma gondii ARI]